MTVLDPPGRERLTLGLRALAFLFGLALMVGVLYAVGSPVYALDEVGARDLEKLERMRQRRAVVLGSSHGMGIIPRHAGLDGENLSHEGQDLFEIVYIARSVRERAPKLDTVVIVLSYFSFTFDNAAYLQNGVQTRIGKRIQLYSGFRRFSVLSGDLSAYFKAVLRPVVTRDHWRELFLGPESESDERSPARKKPRRPSNTERAPEEAGKTPEDDVEGDPELVTRDAAGTGRRRPQSTNQRNYLANHALKRCRKYDELIRVMVENRPTLRDDAYEALLELARELRDDGVRLVLVLPPYHDAYNACFPRELQELTRENAKKIARRADARFFDFSRDKDFRSGGLYSDADHLRSKGKREFSGKLKQKLAPR